MVKQLDFLPKNISKHIHVSYRKKESNKEKGEFFEDIVSNLLSSLQYEVTKRIKFTGMEIDVLAEHKASSETIFAECKALDSKLQAGPIKELVGEVNIRDVSKGLLFSTSELGKEAKGLKKELESKGTNKDSNLELYTPEMIIELLQDTGRIIDLDSIKDPSLFERRISNSAHLFITSFGCFWGIPLINPNQSSADAIIVFDGEDGDLIDDEEFLLKLSDLFDSLSGLDWTFAKELNERKSNNLPQSINEDTERENVITVNPADDWSDYRPARPKDFVGREDLQKDILDFFEDVRTNKTVTRLIGVTSPSGWGKSSVLLKLQDRCRNRYYKNKFLLYPVDVRAAETPQYAVKAVAEAFKYANNENFIDLQNESFYVGGVRRPFEHNALKKTLGQLEQEEKVMVLFFDQFEEVLSKPELENLFKAIKKLSISIDSEQTNFVIGFAWKTDSTVPVDHPAYDLWHNLKDRRKRFEVPLFSTKDSNEILGKFDNQLQNKRIDPRLRKLLRDHSQGYPWLLKKLCIHVYDLLEEGLQQEEIIKESLNIEKLFESDLESLNKKEIKCVEWIAENSPADYFELENIYGQDVIKKLLDKRIIIRQGQKITLYWDIFRDYIITGEAPNIPNTYIPTTAFSRYYKALKKILTHGSAPVHKLAEEMELTTGAMENSVRDMIMIGNARREGDDVEALQSDTDEAHSEVVRFMKKHFLFREISTSSRQVMNRSQIKQTLKEFFSGADYKENTWKQYTNRMVSWLKGAGLVKEENNLIKVREDLSEVGGLVDLSTLREEKRSFLGIAPPQRVLEALDIISNQTATENDLEENGLRNAFYVLNKLGVLESNENGVIKLNDPQALNKQNLADLISSQETIQYLRAQSDITEASGKEVGELVSKYLGRDWEESSKVRYGNALLQWHEWIEKINKNH